MTGYTDYPVGRWFYTCQNGEGRRCGFFLWDDDAKPREEAAILSNSRNEPRSTQDVYTGVQDNSSSPVLHSPQTTQSSSNSSSTLGHSAPDSLKRPFSKTGFEDADENDSFPWSLSGQEEAVLAKLDVPETPHKAVKFNALATPATSAHRKLPWLDDSARVSSAVSTKNTPSKISDLPKLPPSHSKIGVSQSETLTPQITPTPSRFRDAPSHAQTPSSSLTSEVVDLLHNSNVILPDGLDSQLQDLLTRHDLRTQGITKGRDITRLALKARDAKIVELQATIASLEAERDVDRARLRGLEWQKDMLARGQDFDTEL